MWLPSISNLESGTASPGEYEVPSSSPVSNCELWTNSWTLSRSTKTRGPETKPFLELSRYIRRFGIFLKTTRCGAEATKTMESIHATVARFQFGRMSPAAPSPRLTHGPGHPQSEISTHRTCSSLPAFMTLYFSRVIELPSSYIVVHHAQGHWYCPKACSQPLCLSMSVGFDMQGSTGISQVSIADHFRDGFPSRLNHQPSESTTRSPIPGDAI